MVDSLDREARRMGVTRQSLIKLWLADKLGEKAGGATAGVDPKQTVATDRYGVGKGVLCSGSHCPRFAIGV